MTLRPRGKKGLLEGYFRHDGKRFRVQTHTADERKAMRILEKEFERAVKGEISPVVEKRVMFDPDLTNLILLDYEKNRRASLPSLKSNLKTLRRFFGLDPAIAVSSDRIDKMVIELRAEGYSDTTINHCLTHIVTMYRLAADRTPPLLAYKPRIRKIRGIKNTRKGFFEREDFDKVLKHLPVDFALFVEWLYLTGCRKGEAAKIERRQVRWLDKAKHTGTIVIEDVQTKNGTPRTIPLGGRIAELIHRALKTASLKTPLLFHHDGHQINFGGASPFYQAWLAACAAAGVQGKLVHDLRRTGVRNLRRATGDSMIAKEISGHKTMSVFERYDLKDEDDLIRAAEQLTLYLASERARTKR